jgi:cell division protein FtsW
MASSKPVGRAIRALCAAVLALLTLGLVMLASAGAALPASGSNFRFAQKQAIWLSAGLVAGSVAACLDYHRYRKWAWAILGVSAGALVAVLIFGRRINGAARWLVFGPVQFQPSELAKYALVIFLAFWLEKMQRTAKGSPRPRITHGWWGVLAPLGVAGVLAGLIVREPDLGTALLLMTVALAMCWIAGAHSGWVALIAVLAGLAVTACLVAIFKYGMFHDHYQVRRLIHWWLGDDLQGVNHQQHIAAVALGSGGIWGRGLGNSRMKFGFLPEAHTDFILPVIGEELGLVATLAVVLAFVIVIISGLTIARHAPDMFGRALCFGITLVIGLQAAINIAVVSNVVPNKGMPLPFLSYGGSGLLMTLSALGIMVSVALATLRRPQ